MSRLSIILMPLETHPKSATNAAGLQGFPRRPVFVSAPGRWNRRGERTVELAWKTSNGGCHGELDERQIVRRRKPDPWRGSVRFALDVQLRELSLKVGDG